MLVLKPVTLREANAAQRKMRYEKTAEQAARPPPR